MAQEEETRVATKYNERWARKTVDEEEMDWKLSKLSEIKWQLLNSYLICMQHLSIERWCYSVNIYRHVVPLFVRVRFDSVALVFITNTTHKSSWKPGFNVFCMTASKYYPSSLTMIAKCRCILFLFCSDSLHFHCFSNCYFSYLWPLCVQFRSYSYFVHCCLAKSILISSFINFACSSLPIYKYAHIKYTIRHDAHFKFWFCKLCEKHDMIVGYL